MTELNLARYRAAVARRRVGTPARHPGVVARGNSNLNAVKGIQQRLSQLGFAVQVDGIFGPETERALRQFQKQAGIAVDGKVGVQTLQAMLQAQPPTPNQADPSISAIPAGPKGTGGTTATQQGGGLGAVQSIVSGTPGTAGTGTGSTGRGRGTTGPTGSTRGRGTVAPGTPGSSATAQSGPIGSTTVQQPSGYTWDKGASGTDYKQSSDQLPGAPGQPQNNNPSFNAVHARGAGGKFAVKSGDSGPLVQNTQQALNQAGGANLRTDGKFGAKTEAAVKQFQQKNGLATDGIVGQQTSTALRRRLNRQSQPLQGLQQALQSGIG